MRTLIYALALAGALLASMLTKAAENDSTKVEKKIVKTITITDGETMVIDSVITFEGENITLDVDTFECNRPFPNFHRRFNRNSGNHMGYWNGDIEREIEMLVETDGDSTEIMVIKTPGGKVRKIVMDRDEDLRGQRRMYKYRIDDDAEWMPGQGRGHGRFFHGGPDVPTPPGVHMYRNRQNNMIDLNDPDIISFEKKEIKGGKEKITIIRNKK
ncbi:MAG: hypothetical protein K9H26_17855 [Prolixibacteraceae bacterium]|nr:hypothetical protein [Prolixibacteraceae bacterium]